MTTTLSIPQNRVDGIEEGCMTMTTTLSLPQKRMDEIASTKRRGI